VGRRAPTPSQTVGPFFGFALPFPGDTEAAPAGMAVVRLEGQLLDGEGQPVADGLLEVWAGEQFARCRTDVEGAFHFRVAKPAARHGHAPHLELTVMARGLLRQLATRVYFPDEEVANRSDPALAAVLPERRGTLIARRSGEALAFDVHLQGPEETVFFAL
jgi:protocatechuate 3,4-dioxygenase alpha subunit